MVSILAMEAFAAVAGLPFTEDFNNTALNDTSTTTAEWSTDEQALILSWKKSQGITSTLAADPTASDITTDTNQTTSVTLGDVNGDGHLDLVVGNHAQTNRLYLNDGGGTFGAGSDITADAHNTYSVALGDVDHDGDLDLAVGNNGEANRLYLNDGSGTFGAGSDITADAHNTYSVTLGDVDNDGDLDMVAGNLGEANRLYLNDGSGGFTGSDIVTADTHNTYFVVLGDVDGDGDLDLVAGNLGEVNRLYLNDGSGSFTGSDITADTHLTSSVTLGDVDGDGELDMVAGNYGEANRLYLNDGSGGFTGSDIVTADAHSTLAVALDDVDGDGDLDLVAGNDGPINRLYLNDGSGSFGAGSDITADTHATYFVALGDLDGDGDLDMVAGNDGANRLYLNQSENSAFTNIFGTDVTADTYDTNSVALGDVDGDGDLDMVAGNENQANRLYLNDGSGNFGPGSDITADAHNTQSVTLGDVDGDGDLDLVAGNVVQTNRLYLNDGSGTFGAGSDITADTHNTWTVALGDVDGDGDLDLVENVVMPPHKLYLNDGNGVFVAGSDIGTNEFNPANDMVLGDVDNDGDLDIVTGNESSDLLYLNDGSGGFTSSYFGHGGITTQTVALGDVDGDGDLDIITGDGSSTNRLFLNNGTIDPFSGVSGSDITADAHQTYSVILGDVDGDGDLDLVAGNNGQANRLYLNNGTADPFNGVTGSDITADAHNTQSVTLGDVDGDGDLDMVAGNYGTANRLYQRRHFRANMNMGSSVRVDIEVSNIDAIVMTSTQTLPSNTSIDYYLSNNGGAKYFQVKPGSPFTFPTTGTDLRWKARLNSASPVLSPVLDDINLRIPPQYGSIAFAQSSYSVDENGTSVTITATRTGGSDGVVSVDLNSSDGNATAGSDYTALNTRLSWADGEDGNKTAVLSITNDTDSEGNEQLSLTLSNITGGATLGTSSATVTILDDEDYTPPTGYTIVCDLSDINWTMPANTTITFSGAEVGSTYSYEVTSSRGGGSVTGSGNITVANQQVLLDDLSVLLDGNLTISAALTDASNNTGASATANVMMNAHQERILTAGPGRTYESSAGTDVTFNVKLSSMPTHDVVLDFSSNDTDEGVVVSPSSKQITILPANWDQDHPVVIHSVDDAVGERCNKGFGIVFRATSADTYYDGRVDTKGFINIDNDVPFDCPETIYILNILD